MFPPFYPWRFRCEISPYGVAVACEAWLDADVQPGSTSIPPVRGRFNTNRWNRFRYSVWAQFYDPLARMLTSRRRRSIELAAIQFAERVLIVGAGTGLDLDFLPRTAAITAIDLTPAMLARLERRARRLSLPVQARVMDAQALGFPDHSFDAALLHLILAVIPDPVRCLRETVRVLRPGGRAVIFDKFVPDDGPAPWTARMLQPALSVLATEMTRRLGPIIASAGLRCVHREAAGFGGLYQIAVCQKPAESPPDGATG